MAKSRTKKSVYNFFTAIGSQFLTIVMNFVCRTVFIATLGKTYLGISSLFANVLTMLSLAELGIGTAIIYYMYEPLEKNDETRIIVLMDFYRIAYRVIAILIATIGICLIPFLPYMISGYENLANLNVNTVLIFLLYLLQSVSTYLFFAHRSVIVKADQKEYLLNVVSYAMIIGQNVAQMISLILFKNFTIYITIQVVFVILTNVINAKIAEKRYPFILKKVPEKIKKEEIKNIFKDCRAVFIYKLNRVVLKSTDNIVLSAILGLNAVGLYSNYYIFYTTINSLYIKINGAIIHSIGNLHAVKNKEREHLVFKALVMLMTILGGTVTVGLGTVANEFIEVWIGKDWLIEDPFSILLGFEMLLLSVQYFLSKYRNAVGLFQQWQLLPILGSFINIVSSIILVKYLGVSGIILGTIIAEAGVFMVLDPIVIYKNVFKDHNVLEFYLQFFKQILIISITLIFARYICSSYIINHGWISVFVHSLICGIITPIIMILLNYNKEETQYLSNLFLSKFKKKVRGSR